MEAALLKTILILATGAGAIKFLLFEWEGVVEAWRRVKDKHDKRRRAIRARLDNRQPEGVDAAP
jgi:hypothetical protein